MIKDQVRNIDLVGITCLTGLEMRLLNTLVVYDHAGAKRNQPACYASSRWLAAELGSSASSVRNTLSRLRKKGFIQDIGTTNHGTVYHKVVIPETERKMLEKRNGFKNRIREYRQAVQKNPYSLIVPPKQGEACNHSVAGGATETVARKKRGIKKQKETNPPAADSSPKLSSLPGVPLMTLVPTKPQLPVEAKEEQIQTTPEKKSHKKRDWNNALESMIFFPFLKSCFKNWDEGEAQRLVRLMESKKVDQRSIGYALCGLRYLPKVHENFNQNIPSRPMTIRGLLDNFTKILDYISATEGDTLCSTYRTQLANYYVGYNLDQYRQAGTSAYNREFVSFEDWKRKNNNLGLADILFMFPVLNVRADSVLGGLSDWQRKSVLQDMAQDPEGAQLLTKEIGISFEALFHMSYADAKRMRDEQVSELQSKAYAAKVPSLWSPSMAEDF